MRQDMKDLLVNTGRYGHGGKSAKSRRARFKTADEDTLPRRISAHHQLGWDRKGLGDRLRPLYRFLEHNCGRNWDTVYAEIAKVADHRSVRGHHLLEHVRSYVVPSNYDVGHSRRYGPFFVDADGSLQKERVLTDAERHANYLLNAKRFKWKWEKPKAPNPRIEDTKDGPVRLGRRMDDADHWWEKIEGIWYEFTTIVTKSNYPVEWLIDRGNNVVDIGRVLKETTHRETKKRQVNSKTQKKLDVLYLKKKAA
jgi:hypothetical protein